MEEPRRMTKIDSDDKKKYSNNKSQRDVLGIHHVTAIASDPQRNIDFYTQILGLRLVKLTVNFDDPTTYHLYYGDELGHPGTILTFFPWPNAPRGRRGTGQVIAASFLIPENAIDFWINRLKERGVGFARPAKRFGNEEEVITFYDPDGLELELVAHKSAEARTANIWKDGPIPIEHALRGFYSVTLSEEGYERTASVLTEQLGFHLIREEGSRFRYEIIREAKANGESTGSIVDVVCLPYTQRGFLGAGTVHHVAWHTPTDHQQSILRHRIVAAGLDATPVIDRTYFHSVYFREPGGVLFEIATNPPGFTIDETQEELGTHLMLPPWLESDRKNLQKLLPKVNLPTLGKATATPRQAPPPPTISTTTNDKETEEKQE
ncbi:MAG: ring-cleaving dioxygenase [Thermoproteota archaeon]|nr:ring-cleaving dioxygenase [Thermoproteota archaeon]